MKIKLAHNYDNIISIENLLEAWKEFVSGKKFRKDVQEFQLNLMGNILELHRDLADLTYKHGGYQAFNICDPKPRNIHKTTVRDRLLHHAIYRILYPFFDRLFTSDSFSCRNKKGTHKALNRFKSFACKVSKNNTRTCWILKCDIRKFFANIDQSILTGILEKYISDQKIIWLAKEILISFSSVCLGVGLPLGNLTSQLFVNIFMNEFDQFMKHNLKTEYYVRYADDFVILSDSKPKLIEIVKPIREFLKNNLKLELHPDKVFIKTLYSGVDFLGWVNFFDHRVLRTSTKKRMFKNLETNTNPQVASSYLGLLKHGYTEKIRSKIISLI